MIDTTTQLSGPKTATPETPFTLRSMSKGELQKLLITIIDSLSLSSLSTEQQYKIRQDFFQISPPKLAQFHEWYIEPKLVKTIFLSPDLEYGVLTLPDVDEILAATAEYIFTNFETSISHFEDGKKIQFFQVLALLRFSHPHETQTIRNLKSHAVSLFGIVQALSADSEKEDKKLEKIFPIDVSGDAIQAWKNGLADLTQEITTALESFRSQEQIWNSIKLSRNSNEYAVSTLRQGYNIWLNNLLLQNILNKNPLPALIPQFQKDNDNTVPVNERDLRNFRFIDTQLRIWIDKQLIEKHEKEATDEEMDIGKRDVKKVINQNEIAETPIQQPKTTKELIELTRDSYAYRREVVLLKRILIPELVNLSLAGAEGGELSFEEIRINYPVEFARLQDLLLQEINAQFLKTDINLWRDAEGRQRLTETVLQRILSKRTNIGLIEVSKLIQEKELSRRFKDLPEKDAQEKTKEALLRTDEIFDIPDELTKHISARIETHTEEFQSPELEKLLIHFNSLKDKSEHLMLSLSELHITSEQRRLILAGMGGGILNGKSAEQFRFLNPDQFEKVFGFKPSESLCIQLSQIISDNYPFNALQIASDYKNPTFEFNNNPKAALIQSNAELNDPNIGLKEKQKILNSIGANWSPIELDDAENLLAATQKVGGVDTFFYVFSATQTDLDNLRDDNPEAYRQVQEATNLINQRRVAKDLQDQARYLLTLPPDQRQSAMANPEHHVEELYKFKKTIQPGQEILKNLHSDNEISTGATPAYDSKNVREFVVQQQFVEESGNEYGYIGSIQTANDVAEEEMKRRADEFIIDPEYENYWTDQKLGLEQFYGSTLTKEADETKVVDENAGNEIYEAAPSQFSVLRSGTKVVQNAVGLRKKFLATKKAANVIKDKIVKKAAGKIAGSIAEKAGVALVQPIPIIGQIAAIISFIPPKFRKYIAGALGVGAIALLSKVFATGVTAVSTIGGAIGGFLVGGPIGAVIGGIAGYAAGSVAAPYLPTILGGTNGSSQIVKTSASQISLRSSSTRPPFLSTPGGTAAAAFSVGIGATAVAMLLGSTLQAAFLPPPLPIEGGQSAYVLIEKKTDPGSKFDQPRDITYTISITPKEGYTLTINDIRDTFAVQINTKKNSAPSLIPADSPITLETLKSSNGGSTIIKSGQTVTLPAYTEKFDASYHDTGVINTVNIAFTADDGNGNAPIDKSSTKASVCFGDCPLPPTGCWPTTGELTQGPHSVPDKYKDRSHLTIEAVDIEAKRGTPVYATFPGNAFAFPEGTGWRCAVGTTDRNNNPNPYCYGNHVRIFTDNKLEFGYAHLDKFNDQLNMNSVTPVHVDAGTLIGFVGNTGMGGNHLHYEVRPITIDMQTIVPDPIVLGNVKSCYDK